MSQSQFEFVAVLSEEAATKFAHDRAASPNSPMQRRPHTIASDAKQFIRWARQIEGIAVRHCNGEERPTDEAREAGITKRAQALADEYGAKVLITGDPRGFTFRLLFASGVANTWGGKEGGYGVPTR